MNQNKAYGTIKQAQFYMSNKKEGSERLLGLSLSLLFSKCDYLYASTKNSTLLAIISAIDSNPAMSRINGNKKS